MSIWLSPVCEYSLTFRATSWDGAEPPPDRREGGERGASHGGARWAGCWNRSDKNQIEWYKTPLEGLVLLKKQGLLGSSFVLMLSVVVSRIAGLIFKIPLTNLLGGAGMGYFQSAYTVFTPIYSICAVSLPPAISALVAENSAFARYRNIRNIKKTALIVFSAISLVLALIPMIFAEFIAVRIIGSENAQYAIAAISPCIFFGTVTAVYRGYFEGLRNMTPTAVSQMVEAIVRVICGLGFAFFASCNLGGINDFTLPLIAAAAILGITAADLAGLIYIVLRYTIGGDGITKQDLMSDTHKERKRTALKQLIVLMIPMALASLVSSLMNAVDLSTIMLCIKSSLRNQPQLYAEKYAEIIDSGVSLDELPNFLYGSFTGLAMTVFSLAPSLCSVFGKSSLPTISEAYAKKDTKTVSKEIIRVIAIVSVISIPSGLGLSVMAKEVLQILFASRQSEIAVSIMPLAIISLGTPFLAISGAVFSMLQAVGKQDTPVKITMTAAVIKLVLNMILVPMTSLGISGAAISTLASFVVICIMSLNVLLKHTKTSLRACITPLLSLFSGLISAAAAMVSVSLLNKYEYFLAHYLQIALISIVNAVIIYIILIILLDKSTKNRLIKEIFK